MASIGSHRWRSILLEREFHPSPPTPEGLHGCMAAWMIRREDPGAGELGYLAHYGSETWYIGNLVAIKPRAMTTMRRSRVWEDRGRLAVGVV